VCLPQDKCSQLNSLSSVCLSRDSLAIEQPQCFFSTYKKQQFLLFYLPCFKKVNVWFEASTEVTIFSYSFWFVTQRRFSLVRDQRLGTVYSYHLQGSHLNVPVRTGPWTVYSSHLQGSHIHVPVRTGPWTVYSYHLQGSHLHVPVRTGPWTVYSSNLQGPVKTGP
jgi:hypothetical protein